MILPGLPSLLMSNLSVSRLEGEVLVWSAWSLSDSWAAWASQLSTTTTSTTRRQRYPNHSGSSSSVSDTSYSSLLVLSCSASLLLVLLLAISLSCWLAINRWRSDSRENTSHNTTEVREYFQFQWNVVDQGHHHILR